MRDKPWVWEWECYSQPGDYGISAKLWLGGLLDYRVRTKAPSAPGARDGTPSGREMYQEMMRAVGRQRVKTIQERWLRFPPLNANYISYKSAIKAGMPPNRAVFETFGGKMAAEAGFRYGRFISEENYTITAHFTREYVPGAAYLSPAERPGW
jgi:hypothetical protein